MIRTPSQGSSSTGDRCSEHQRQSPLPGAEHHGQLACPWDSRLGQPTAMNFEDGMLVFYGCTVLLFHALHFAKDEQASVLAGFVIVLAVRIALALARALPVITFVARHGLWGLRVVARAYARGLWRWILSK